MSLNLSLIEWLQVTAAAIAAMSPLYVIMGKMLEQVIDMKNEIGELKAEFVGIVKNCPYCMRKVGDD